MAQQLSAAGCAVTICGRDTAKLERAQQLVPALRSYACDIASWDHQDRLLDELRRQRNLPDILVNNAAVIGEVDFVTGTASWEQMVQQVETNLLAPMRLIHQLLPHLQAQPEAAIVNVTTGLVYAPSIKHPVYCAVKAGLHTFSVALRQQLTATTVEVFEVLPPPVDTALNTSTERKLPADEVASSMVRALQAGRHELHIGRARALSMLSRITRRGALKVVNR